jgi:hypothetical protein
MCNVEIALLLVFASHPLMAKLVTLTQDEQLNRSSIQPIILDEIVVRH